MATPRNYKRDGSGKFSGNGSASTPGLASGSKKRKKSGGGSLAANSKGAITNAEGLKRFGGRWNSRSFRASTGFTQK